MNDLPRITVSYAIDNGDASGPTYATEEEARRHPLYLAGHAIVVRLYADPDGRIVHTEEVPDGPQE